ncbi:MAG: mannose-6-phosphate isomerase-like protein (cupin superfamily) [Roseivirga sp.]|jgi:mannose-6-phosphate isomerase-like protein (cupin superfamily)
MKREMKDSKVNVLGKFDLFNDQWKPRIIGELNGQLVKLAKLTNDFVWHSHENEDELFLVWKGELIMEFRDRTEVIKEGEMIVVPKGVEHNPRTKDGEEVWVMLFEPAATLHTGAVQHERTHNNQEWI